jgi:sodium pump decarboxylase gamma subunit
MIDIDRILYALELTVVGMTSVFVVLIFFSLLIWFMKYVDAKITENKIKKSVVNDEDLQTEIIEDNDNDELVAIITAAIQMSVSKKAKIKHIHFLGHQAHDGKWATAGRLNVMSSHNLNKRN